MLFLFVDSITVFGKGKKFKRENNMRKRVKREKEIRNRVNLGDGLV